MLWNSSIRSLKALANAKAFLLLYLKGVINMKFKMTKMTHEQIDEVNTLLETYGDSFTAFYDEAFWLGAKQGIIDPKFELREA